MTDPGDGVIERMLEQGILTPGQVEECRAACPAAAKPGDLLAILRKRGYLDSVEMAAILPRPASSPPSARTPDPRGATQLRDVPSAEGAARGYSHHQTTDGGPVGRGVIPRDGTPRRLGPFEILEELGRGGMGAVWRARDTRLGRIVALKGLLGPRAGVPPAAAARLLREARAAARLQHPHIVSIHELGEIDREIFLVMDCIDGHTLLEHIRRVGADLHARVRMLRDLALAVAHAHSVGILHRDLKPENVLVDVSGHAWVTDFGLAKDFRDGGEALTATGAMIGTPAYMSPEQAVGGSVDARTDVWGLGGTMYAALTGEPPFAGKGIPDVIRCVTREEPMRPSIRNPQVPRDLETICLKCLEKDPDRRYPTAQALCEDLDRWLAGESIRAMPVSRVARAWRWARRRPGISLAAAGTVCAVAIAGGMAHQALREAGALRRSVLESEFHRAAELPLVQAIERRRIGDAAGLERALAEALETAQARLREDSHSAAAWYVQGWVHRLGDRWGEADQALTEAHRLKPGDRAILYQRGLARAGLYRAALDRARRRLHALGEEAMILSPAVEERLRALEPGLAPLRARAEEDFAGMDAGGSTPGDDALDEASLLCGRGLLALHRGDFRTASRLLQQALERDPYRDEVWDGLLEAARFHVSDDASERLLDLYRRAVEVNRGRWTLWAGFAEAYAHATPGWMIVGSVEQASEFLRQGNEALLQATRLAPDQPELLSLRATLLTHQAYAAGLAGRDSIALLAAAVESGRDAERARPGSADARFTLGTALRVLGEALPLQEPRRETVLREAIAVLDRCVEIAPGLVAARLERGRVGLALHETLTGAAEAETSLQMGIADFDAILERHAHVVLAWLYRAEGWILRARTQDIGGEDAARSLGEIAHALAEVERLGRGNRADCLQRRVALSLLQANRARRTGQDWLDPAARAEKDCRVLLSRLPFDPATWTSLGQAIALRADALEHARGDPLPLRREALGMVTRALELEPGEPNASLLRARLRLALARTRAGDAAARREWARGALADLQVRIDRGPAAPEVWWLRGDVHRLSSGLLASDGGDPRPLLREAIEDYDRAVSLDPHDAWGMQRSGEVRIGLADAETDRGGDPEPALQDAVERLTRALRLRPGYVHALTNRGTARKGLGLRAAKAGRDATPWLESALEDYRAATMADPNLWPAWVHSGETLELLDRPAEAVAAYEEASRRGAESFPPFADMLARARTRAARKGR